MNKNSTDIQNSSRNNITSGRKFLFIGLAIICSIVLLIIYNIESPESDTNVNSEITQHDNMLPIDFDPFNYLKLNPDLQTVTEKMTSDEEKIAFAQKHYIEHGKIKGRKY